MSGPGGRLYSGPTFALDFQARCSCGNQATHFLEIHAVDYCTEDRPTWSKLMCATCLAIDVNRAWNVVADGEEWCSSCGLTLVNLGDIIVRQTPLTMQDKGGTVRP